MPGVRLHPFMRCIVERLSASEPFADCRVELEVRLGQRLRDKDLHAARVRIPLLARARELHVTDRNRFVQQLQRILQRLAGLRIAPGSVLVRKITGVPEVHNRLRNVPVIQF